MCPLTGIAQSRTPRWCLSEAHIERVNQRTLHGQLCKRDLARPVPTFLLDLYSILFPHHPARMTIYKPDFPEPTLVESSLFEYLFPQKAGDSPLPTFEKKLPAYIDGLTGRTLSRGDVEDNALQLATGIRGLGLKKNDVACLWGTNSLEWTQAAFGCMAAGLCISPANYA